jgi:uncharacterized integral membrane protein
LHAGGSISQAVGARVIRRVATVLMAAALALLLLSFALANRQTVTVSFDPFDQANPALAIALPLYQLIFVLLILGVLAGGSAAWLRQAKWRARARRAERAAAQGEGAHMPVAPSSGAPRLVIPPPAA